MGSIVIDTRFDNSGFENGFKRALAATKSFVGSVTNNIAGVGKSFDTTTAAIMKQQAVVDDLKAKIQALTDIEIKSPTFEQLSNDLKISEQELKSLTQQYNEAVSTLAEFRDIGFKDENLSAQIAEVERLSPIVAEAESKTALLRQELTALNMPTQPKETAEQLALKLGIAEQRLSELQIKAQQLGNTAPKAMRDTGVEAQKAARQTKGFGSAIGSFAKRIKSLIAAVLVFQVIRTALRGVRDYLGAALKSNQEFVHSFAQVKGNLAAAFQPILQTVIPILAKLMQWLAAATAAVLQFMAAISGKSVKSLQAAAKGMDKLKKSTAGAGAAAKGALASFDELIVLQMPGGGGAADIFAPEYPEIPEPDLSMWAGLIPIWEKLKKLGMNIWDGVKRGIEKIDFEHIKSLFSRLGTVLGELLTVYFDNAFKIADSMTKTIGKFLEYFIAISGKIFEIWVQGITQALENNKQAIIDWLNWWGDAVSGIWDDFTSIIESIFGTMFNVLSEKRDQLAGVVEQIVSTIGNIFGTLVYIIIDTFSRITSGIATWFIENQNKFAEYWTNIIDTITQFVNVTATVINDFLEILKFNWDTYFGGFIDTVIDMVMSVYGWVLDLYNKFFAPTIIAMLDWFKKIWDENLKDVVNEFLGFVGRIGEIITVLWNNILKPVIDWIIKNIVPPIQKVAGFIIDIVGNILNVISGIIKSIIGVINGIIDFIMGVFTGNWEKAWGGVSKIFTSIWDGIKNAFIGVINTLISALNALLSAVLLPLNAIIKGLNQIPGVSIPTLSLEIPKIPRLATGAVIPPNKEFLAIMGDQKSGRNIETPENLLRQIMREEGSGGDSPLMQRMVELLERIAAKEGNVVFAPSAAAGRVITQSTNMFETVRG